jgi:transcriptional regulator with XRE-family HTH domain
LRALRAERKLSIRDLAKQAGVSPVAVWHWEHGHNKPRARSIPALLGALGLPAGSLSGLPDNDEALAASLANVVDQAKQIVAKAAGTSPDQIVVHIVF